VSLTPKISVVIPTYNCAAYLPETLASVISQSFQGFEIIVVDDGSTDDTRKLFDQADHRLVYLPQDHSGIPAKVRNKALELARGEFIAFLDSDDLWETDKLERQVGLMKTRPDVEACFTDHCSFGVTNDKRTAFQRSRTNLDRLQKVRVAEDEYVITSPSFFEDCLLRGPIPLWTSTIVVRRSCLAAVGQFNEEMSLDDDTQMWLRLAKQCRFGYIDKVLAKRRIRASSISASANASDTQICSLRTFETLDRWLSLNENECSALRFRAAQTAFSIGYGEFSRNNFRAARCWLRISLKKKFSWRPIPYLLSAYIPARTIPYLRLLKRSLSLRRSPQGAVDSKSLGS